MKTDFLAYLLFARSSGTECEDCRVNWKSSEALLEDTGPEMLCGVKLKKNFSFSKPTHDAHTMHATYLCPKKISLFGRSPQEISFKYPCVMPDRFRMSWAGETSQNHFLYHRTAFLDIKWSKQTRTMKSLLGPFNIEKRSSVVQEVWDPQKYRTLCFCG